MIDFGMSIFVDRMERRSATGTDRHGTPTLRLTAAISAHKACFPYLRERTVSASEMEMKTRWQIIAYEPRNKQEALQRLSYLFAIIATAGDWLEDDEVEEFLNIVRNY